MMYIYDYNLQFFFSYGNYLFGQNFKILIETYRTLFKFSLLNTYLCVAWAPQQTQFGGPAPSFRTLDGAFL